MRYDAAGTAHAATNPRWGGGAVERAGLENRYTLRGIAGSNPAPTAFLGTNILLFTDWG